MSPHATRAADHRWELIACALRGHATYEPTDEPPLERRLRVDAPAGPAWRCLRCGTYVVGAPAAFGPADRAPAPARGAAVRDAVIMRLLAVERLLRAVVLWALACGVWRFAGSQDAIRRSVDAYLPDLRDIAARAGVRLDDTLPARVVERALGYGHHELALLTVAVAAYGALEALEGVGLWTMHRWGEYVAVVGTAVFLPLEVRDIVEHVTAIRVGTFALNLAAVVWLVVSKRLFGVRGGAGAARSAQEGRSLVDVERAAATPR